MSAVESLPTALPSAQETVEWLASFLLALSREEVGVDVVTFVR